MLMNVDGPGWLHPSSLGVWITDMRRAIQERDRLISWQAVARIWCGLIEDLRFTKQSSKSKLRKVIE